MYQTHVNVTGHRSPSETRQPPAPRGLKCHCDYYYY